ncbi:MAG: threalose-6-phosphate phosphatase [Alectoria sarmentosa]|nr:MAG: threalose-6-phosphate phosphatase [Alectoria sarmentosa]
MVAQRLEEANILATYHSAKQSLLLFDYDGTLTPIVENPAAAILSDEALRSIQKLASDPRNAVWIISGRNQSFLEQLFGHLTKIGLVAEHGSFLRSPGSGDWEDLTAKVDMTWQEEVVKIFRKYTDLTPGSRIEKKCAAVVWHFRQASQDYATLQAAECKKDLESTIARNYPLEFINGKCVLEARLRFVNKGQIAQRLVDEIRAVSGKPPDFVLCFGDDVTDEDMFRALRDSDLPKNTVFSVTIGESQKLTDADWILSDPTEVVATIMMLNESDGYIGGEDTGQSGSSNRVLPVPRSFLLGSGP